MKTPYTEVGLRKYDHLTARHAVRLAWTRPGKNPAAHEAARQVVRDAMPVLARALDRMERRTP